MARSESKSPRNDWVATIRRDWDARALEDPRAYIDWPDVAKDDEAFFASGRQDYERYVPPFLAKMKFNPRDKTALEIGCGIGRIARWMSQDFGQYIGVDVSPEMVRKATSYGLPRARFQAVSGGDLSGIPDASVDFVFSFAVFQHIPDRGALLSYIAETERVLRPGGIFRLHMKGLWTLPLGRFVVEGGLPHHDRSSRRSVFARLPFIRVRRLDTWQGRSIPRGEAVVQCQRAGLEVLDIENAWTTMMWVSGRKRLPV